MANVEHYPSVKENLKAKCLVFECAINSTDKVCKETKPIVKKPPPIVSQKPVLRRLEAQTKLNHKPESNEHQESCKEPIQREKEHHVSTSSVNALTENIRGCVLNESLKNHPKPPQDLNMRSSIILKRIQNVKVAPVRCEDNDKLHMKVCVDTKNCNKEQHPKIPERKSTTLNGQSINNECHSGTIQKIDARQNIARLENKTKFYKLLSFQSYGNRAPRKPARPPIVNLDSTNSDGNSDMLTEQNSHNNSRPISILTEKQESEEMRSFPGIRRNDLLETESRNSGNSDGVEFEELYQELD